MSFKAMAFAAEQSLTQTSSQTLLLLILANFANEEDLAYPSYETLSKLTRLDKRTVKKCLNELIDFGLIIDTQMKYKKQIKVYKILIKNDNNQGGGLSQRGYNFDTPNKNDTPNNFASQGGTILHRKGVQNCSQGGTILYPNPINKPINDPINEPVSVTHMHTHAHAHEQSNHNFANDQFNQKLNNGDLNNDYLNNCDLNNRELKIKTCFDFAKDNISNDCHSSSNSPLENKKPQNKSENKKLFLSADDLVNLGVDLQVAKDYLAIRKNKLTQTAINGIINQAILAKIDVNTAIRFTVENGWQSFKADWYFNRQTPSHTGAKRNITEQLAEIDKQWQGSFYPSAEDINAQNQIQNHIDYQAPQGEC